MCYMKAESKNVIPRGYRRGSPWISPPKTGGNDDKRRFVIAKKN